MGELAFGHPGIEPRWTSSAKQGMGTAYSTASRVWFTLSHGILNEIYYPTIDRPQTRDCQLLITDGETFLDEEKRDLKQEVAFIHPDALGYRLTGSCHQGRYRLLKEVISDPHQPCVLMNVKLECSDASLRPRLQLYALLAPHLEVGGYGNTGWRMQAAGKWLLVARKDNVFVAMGCDCDFLRTSCGFVGASDGWTDLKDNYRMDWEFERADDGNIALMGQVDLRHADEFTLGIAFGYTLHSAITTLVQSLAVPYAQHRERFVRQWQRVCSHAEPLDEVSGDEGFLFRTSHHLLLAHEDKVYAGATIASASIPWGQAKGDDDIGGYHLVWTRDMVQAAGGLLAVGDTVTPNRALVYLACSQRPDGGFPQNFWINGEPYWNGIQLDQVAFPIVLAWRLWKGGALMQFDPYPMVLGAAKYLIVQGPATRQERWEHASGYSPSTLAVVIAALICAAEFARDRQDNKIGRFFEESADFLESHVDAWTVTRRGSLVEGIARHYVRILPTDPLDVSPEEDPDNAWLTLADRVPGEAGRFPANRIIDAGFLELVRYGIRKPDNPLMVNSLRVVDALLKVETPCGQFWRRFNYDGYGEHADGSPFDGSGIGRPWPLLTGERGHYELAAGRDVAPYIRAMEACAVNSGLLPEQIWDAPDIPEKGLRFGHPTGSAKPLVWAHAEYLKLLRSRRDGKVFDLVPAVADRYLNGRGRKDLELWKPVRQVRRICPSSTLRVQAPAAFRLRWTLDEWQHYTDADALDTTLSVHYVDIPTPRNQHAPVRFTFFWTAQGRWEGKDYKVDVAGM